MANFTQKAILSNFEQMLVEMPFDKITVSALVERCEISSNTFYYHFRDIYDLLDSWLMLKKQSYVEKHMELADWEEHLRLILLKLQENSGVVFHIFNSISRERIEQFVFVTVQNEVYEMIRKWTEEMGIDDKVIQELSEFYCCSVFGFLLKFLWSHMDVDVDQLVETMKSTFSVVTAYMLEMGRKNQTDKI